MLADICDCILFNTKEYKAYDPYKAYSIFKDTYLKHKDNKDANKFLIKHKTSFLKIQTQIENNILADAKVLAKEIEEKQLVLKMKVGEGGRTFGSISTKEIAAEAKKQLGYDLDKKKMHCEPIKNLGFHDVAIKVHPQVTATLRVKVEEK